MNKEEKIRAAKEHKQKQESFLKLLSRLSVGKWHSLSEFVKEEELGIVDAARQEGLVRVLAPWEVFAGKDERVVSFSGPIHDLTKLRRSGKASYGKVRITNKGRAFCKKS